MYCYIHYWNTYIRFLLEHVEVLPHTDSQESEAFQFLAIPNPCHSRLQKKNADTLDGARKKLGPCDYLCLNSWDYGCGFWSSCKLRLVESMGLYHFAKLETEFLPISN